MRVTIQITREDARFLRAIGEPDAVLAQLANHAIDGVRRPGSWERGWVMQAFGQYFEGRLEPDPSCAWRARPRRGGRQP